MVAVDLIGPAQGTHGSSDLTVTAGGLTTGDDDDGAGLVWADSPVDAVALAVTGSVAVGVQTYELRQGTVSDDPSACTSFVLVPTADGYELRLEDLAATPRGSDWDDNDTTWGVSVTAIKEKVPAPTAPVALFTTPEPPKGTAPKEFPKPTAPGIDPRDKRLDGTEIPKGTKVPTPIHPALPPYGQVPAEKKGTPPTLGILEVPQGDKTVPVPVQSGPGANKPKPPEGQKEPELDEPSKIASRYAEGHAALIMRYSDLKSGVMFINYPDGACNYCLRNLYKILPKDATLIVVWTGPDGKQHAVKITGGVGAQSIPKQPGFVEVPEKDIPKPATK